MQNHLKLVSWDGCEGGTALQCLQSHLVDWFIKLVLGSVVLVLCNFMTFSPRCCLAAWRRLSGDLKGNVINMWAGAKRKQWHPPSIWGFAPGFLKKPGCKAPDPGQVEVRLCSPHALSMLPHLEVSGCSIKEQVCSMWVLLDLLKLLLWHGTSLNLLLLTHCLWYFIGRWDLATVINAMITTRSHAWKYYGAVLKGGNFGRVS